MTRPTSFARNGRDSEFFFFANVLNQTHLKQVGQGRKTMRLTLFRRTAHMFCLAAENAFIETHV